MKNNIITNAFKCNCGAVTVTFENGAVNSMPEETFKEKIKNIKISHTVFNCDYCVNKWGIDLCGCGSGEKVGECSNEYHECLNKIPAQELEVRKEFIGWGS